MHLDTRTGQNTLEEESKRHPNTKVHSEPQENFGTLKGLNFPDVVFGPTAFGDDYAYPFDLFTKGCIWIPTLIVRTYFLQSSGLYKQRLNLII